MQEQSKALGGDCGLHPNPTSQGSVAWFEILYQPAVAEPSVHHAARRENTNVKSYQHTAGLSDLGEANTQQAPQPEPAPQTLSAQETNGLAANELHTLCLGNEMLQRTCSDDQLDSSVCITDELEHKTSIELHSSQPTNSGTSPDKLIVKVQH